jgi:hypothetical protein
MASKGRWGAHLMEKHPYVWVFGAAVEALRVAAVKN